MSKSTVTRLFIGSLISLAAGAVAIVGAVAIAFETDIIVMNGTELAVLDGNPITWTLFFVALVGVLAVAGGIIGGLVSWIGALLNTWRVESKAWFVGLLLLGIFNFGSFAMIAYIIAGPDGQANPDLRTSQAPMPA